MPLPLPFKAVLVLLSVGQLAGGEFIEYNRTLSRFCTEELKIQALNQPNEIWQTGYKISANL